MATHAERKEIIEKQAQAKNKGPAQPLNQGHGALPASAITQGSMKSGKFLCLKCLCKFSSPTGEALGGCSKRRFHPGQYDSGMETVWNGPDYMQYEARDSSWTCCTLTHSGGGCMCLPHQLRERGEPQPEKKKGTEEAARATAQLEACTYARGGAGHEEVPGGPGSGAWLNSEQESKAVTLLDDLCADPNGWIMNMYKKPRYRVIGAAASNGHFDMMKLLISRGARHVNEASPECGRRPLHFVLRQNWLNPGHVRCAWLLCCHGADPDGLQVKHDKDYTEQGQWLTTPVKQPNGKWVGDVFRDGKLHKDVVLSEKELHTLMPPAAHLCPYRCRTDFANIPKTHEARLALHLVLLRVFAAARCKRDGIQCEDKQLLDASDTQALENLFVECREQAKTIVSS